MDFKEDFIYRILAGEVSEEEELAFRKRLAEDEAERKEFERIGQIWYRGKYAGKWESISNSDLYKLLVDHLNDNNIYTEEERRNFTKEQKKSRTIVKGQKIGRNDPCPCGSGKKYKKCCGANL